MRGSLLADPFRHGTCILVLPGGHELNGGEGVLNCTRAWEDVKSAYVQWLPEDKLCWGLTEFMVMRDISPGSPHTPTHWPATRHFERTPSNRKDSDSRYYGKHLKVLFEVRH